MAQLDINGFYDLVFSTAASIVLGIIIISLLSITAENSLNTLRWQVNYKTYIIQFINLLNIFKVINNIFKNQNIFYLKIIKIYNKNFLLKK